MVALPASSKLESEVLTRSIGRHRVRSGAMSTGGPDLQRQIEFHSRPVFMRPELIISRRKRIQQCTDACSGSRDPSLMNITYFDDADPGITGMKPLPMSVGATAEQRQKRITTSAPRARLPVASERRTGGTERRKTDRVYQPDYGLCRRWRRRHSFHRRRALSAPIT